MQVCFENSIVSIGASLYVDLNQLQQSPMTPINPYPIIILLVLVPIPDNDTGVVTSKSENNNKSLASADF